MFTEDVHSELEVRRRSEFLEKGRGIHVGQTNFEKKAEKESPERVCYIPVWCVT